MRVSYSQINSYAHCPEQYRLERVVRVPQQPAWALVGGKAVHSMTEDYDRGKETLSFDTYLDREIADQAEFSDIPKSDWRASGRKSNDWPLKENEDWWRHHGPLFFDRWVRWTSGIPWVLAEINGEPAIEVEIALDYGEVLGENVTDLGFIDRVYRDPRSGQLIVVDLKTGARMPPTTGQLGFYAVHLREQFGLEVNLGAFWDARQGAAGPTHDLEHYDLETLDYKAKALAVANIAGLYIPAPSAMCVSCSVRDFCREYSGPDAIEVPRPALTVPESE